MFVVEITITNNVVLSIKQNFLLRKIIFATKNERHSIKTIESGGIFMRVVHIFFKTSTIIVKGDSSKRILNCFFGVKQSSFIGSQMFRTFYSFLFFLNHWSILMAESFVSGGTSLSSYFSVLLALLKFFANKNNQTDH